MTRDEGLDGLISASSHGLGAAQHRFLTCTTSTLLFTMGFPYCVVVTNLMGDFRAWLGLLTSTMLYSFASRTILASSGILVALLISTACFLIYREVVISRVLSKDGRPLSRTLSFDDPEQEEGRDFSQVGYRTSRIGSGILFGWIAALVGFYLLMVLLCVVSYFPAVQESWQTDWDGVVAPCIFAMLTSHILAAIMAKFYRSVRTKFMLPEPDLSHATHVGIQEVDVLEVATLKDSSRSEVDDSHRVSRYFDVFIVKLKKLRSMYIRASRRTVVKVQAEAGRKFFEFTCVRFVFDKSLDTFKAVGHITPTVARLQRAKSNGGLTLEEAMEMKDLTGSNEIAVEVPGIFRSLVNEFADTIYAIQSAGAWVYIVYTTWNIGCVWMAMIVLAGVYRALFIVRRGQKKIADMAKLESRVNVLRNNKWIEIGSHDVVLGDLLKVEEGEPLPCDGVIVDGSIIVNESMLTGEPMPIQKFPVEDIKGAEISKKNTAYAGTICVLSTNSKPGGRAVMMATAVGAQTAKGSLVRMVLFPETVKFKFSDQLPFVYLLLGVYAAFIIILLLSIADLGSPVVTWLEALCTVTQTMNPMLPVSLVLGQSVCAKRLERKWKISCLQPGRIPVAGKISTMVFDKTGTITKDGMDLDSLIPIHPGGGKFMKRVQLEQLDIGIDKTNETLISTEVPLRMQYGLACCHTVTSLRDGTLVGNNVEVTMFSNTGWSLPNTEIDESENIITSPNGDHKLKVLKKLDFDHHRMTSGSVVRDLSTGEAIVIVKGSYERIAAISHNDTIPVDYVKVTERCASDNFYTLAMASKLLDGSLSDEEIISSKRDSLESGLSMCGLLLFRNEMKPDSRAAIEALTAGAVRSVMCTGDNVLTGVSIAKECGIMKDCKERRILIGDFDAKEKGIIWTDINNDDKFCEVNEGNYQLAVTGAAWKYLIKNPLELDRIWEDIYVFARMKPEDKVNVTKYLQSHKLVVGMCGDGGNDCGALRAAHAGMALSDAEASMVSPFSSGRDGRSLFTVVDMIREGRACLATNVATYSFFIVYALVFTCARVTGTFIGNLTMGEWFWITQDLLLGVIIVWTMTLSAPTKHLAPYRPTASLLGWRTVLTCAFPVVSYYIAQGVAFGIMWSPSNSHWYQHLNSLDIHIPPQEWTKKGDNYDIAAQVPMVFTVLITHAFVSTYGGAFRRSILFNWALTVVYILFNILVFSLIWTNSNALSCVYRVNCDTGSSLDTKGLPIIEQYSVGTIGGCFWGPQIRRYQLSFPEMADWTPDPAFDCRPHGPGAEEALRMLPWDSPLISTLGYDGPNNVYPSSYRLSYTVVLLCYIFAQHIFFCILARRSLGGRMMRLLNCRGNTESVQFLSLASACWLS